MNESQINLTTMLRFLRERVGLTREQLISRMENTISLSTLIRWERGDSEPSMSLEQWHLFSNAVGVPLGKLPYPMNKKGVPSELETEIPA